MTIRSRFKLNLPILFLVLMIGLAILSCGFPSSNAIQDTIESQIQQPTSLPESNPTLNIPAAPDIQPPTVTDVQLPTAIQVVEPPESNSVQSTNEVVQNPSIETLAAQTAIVLAATPESRTKPTVKPIPYDDYVESSGCPQGVRCITSGSFAWPTADASYCIAPPTGMTVNGKTIWGDADIDTYAADAERYWRLNTGFNLYKVNACGNNTNIVLGWITNLESTTLGSTWSSAYTTDQQIIIALNYGTNKVVTDPKDGSYFHWEPLLPDNAGYDGSLVMAHEMGHALGLGHDQVDGMLMFPNAQRTVTYSDNYPLGQDSINQMAAKYGELAVGPFGLDYQKIGISGEYLTAENGQMDVKYVYLPDGLKDRLNDVRAACGVVGYLPNGDDDLSFNCHWDLTNAVNGSIAFYLETSHSNQSTVMAYAFVWDHSVYPILDTMSFTMNADFIWVNDINGVVTQYPLPYTHRFSQPFNLAQPVAVVNRYETFGSKDFGWRIFYNPDESVTFSTVYSKHPGDAYIQGWIPILGWTGDGTSYTNAHNVDAEINWAFNTVCGNQAVNQTDSNLDIWEGNASAFASMILYDPTTAGAYGAYCMLRTESSRTPSPGVTDLDGECMSQGGYNNSCATFHYLLFQIGPP